jgi:hypothetical protein
MAITIDIKEDTLYQLGQQEGKVEAKEATAINMLKEGFGIELVARSTGLPAERIAQLRQNLDTGH